MAFTSVTITGTIKGPSGQPVNDAEVSFEPDQDMVNSTVHASGAAVQTGSDGTFSITVSATDDSGTTTATGSPGHYNVKVIDPIEGGEHLYDFRCVVPKTPNTTTFATLLASAV